MLRPRLTRLQPGEKLVFVDKDSAAGANYAFLETFHRPAAKNIRVPRLEQPVPNRRLGETRMFAREFFNGEKCWGIAHVNLHAELTGGYMAKRDYALQRSRFFRRTIFLIVPDSTPRRRAMMLARARTG